MRFSTYAVPYDYRRDPPLPAGQQPHPRRRCLRDTAYKVLQARDRLQYAERGGMSHRGRNRPGAMELPVEEVVFALEAIQDPVSLFEPIYNDGGDAL